MAACVSYSGGPKVGADCFFYINEGTVAVPSWTEIGEITDFSVDDFSVNLAELKRRSNNYTKNVAALFNSITLSFRLVHGLDKAIYDLLNSTFMARTPVMATVADRDITTAGAGAASVEVLELPILITAFPWDQPLEDVTGHDITAAVAYMCDETPTNEIDPEWKTLVA